jgi:uncharacterized membrane-anchored protein
MEVDGVRCPLHNSADDTSVHMAATHEHLSQLCRHFHVAPPHADATFFTADLAGTCTLRWERHTEVQTYTFTRPATEEDLPKPFESSPLTVIPEWWSASLPGTIVASTHFALLEVKAVRMINKIVAQQQRFEWIASQFGRSSLVTAATIDSGRFRVYSDWRVHNDGFGRMLILSDMPPETPNKRSSAGKVLQRLVEVRAASSVRALAWIGVGRLGLVRRLVWRVCWCDAT